MNTKTSTPDKLKPLMFHGADLKPKGDNWEGTCPLCGKERHFYAHPETGQWDCKVCGESGNASSFLTKLITACLKSTGRKQLKQLSSERKIPSGILRQNKVCYHGLMNAWLVPAYDIEDSTKVVNVLKWSPRIKGTLTWGCKAVGYGLSQLNSADNGTTVWLCEAPWDKMAIEWLLREIDDEDSIAVSLPGAGTFKDEWARLFSGCNVVSVFDADEAGAIGEEKAYDKTKTYVETFRFVKWPDSRPTGYDARDFVSETLGNGEKPDKVIQAFEKLLSEHSRRHTPEPNKCTKGKKKKKRRSKISYAEVHSVFEKAMSMSDDTRTALDICLAVCVSNDVPGDPLWAYLVGPPSCGKTMLLSALQSSDRCLFRSTVTPHCLVSGWRGEGKNDPSLVPKLSGKTFVAKDFTEILTMPASAQDEIFSTLRGAYDGRVQKSFGNGVFRNYENCHFSTLAGVTNAIHAHPKANLGERFLKFQFRVQDGKSMRIVNQAALASIGKEKETETVLQNACSQFLDQEFVSGDLPKLPDRLFERLNSLVQMIALLRTMVERDWRGGEVTYRPAVEGSARLIKQLGKLAMCIALVRGSSEVTDDIYGIVERVAYDSAHGFHMDVIRAMMSRGGTGQKKHVSEVAGIPYSTIHRHFEDLEILGVIERVKDKDTVTPGRAIKRTTGRPAATFTVARKVVELWNLSKGKECPKTKKTRRKKKRGSRRIGVKSRK